MPDDVFDPEWGTAIPGKSDIGSERDFTVEVWWEPEISDEVEPVTITLPNGVRLTGTGRCVDYVIDEAPAPISWLRRWWLKLWRRPMPTQSVGRATFRLVEPLDRVDVPHG